MQVINYIEESLPVFTIFVTLKDFKDSQFTPWEFLKIYIFFCLVKVNKRKKGEIKEKGKKVIGQRIIEINR